MSATMSAAPLHADLARVLNEIEDPELGIGIVDLGLVYGADWTATGIEVDFTTTASTCPLGDVLRQRIDDVLHLRFREAASIRVRLVLQPPWTPERLSEAARQKLGWMPAPAPPCGRGSWKN